MSRTSGWLKRMYAQRRDETEKPIVDALRKMGFLVQQQTLPDLLIRNKRTGTYHLLEIEGITRNRKRSVKQLEWLTLWQVPIVKSLDEALKALGCQM
jgi:hypothetical protein